MKLKSGHGAALVVNYKDRILWLQGGIIDGVGCDVKKALDKMNRESSTPPIRFYLSSPGGIVPEEIIISRAVDASVAPVVWIAFNKVFSAALNIFQSGKKRYAVPHTKFMFHRTRHILTPRSGHGIIVDAEDCIRRYGEIKTGDALALCQLTRHALFEDVEPLLAREAVISVAHAIRIGMIDGYYDTKEFRKDQRIIAKQYYKSR